jgi:hypothetical protein
MVNDPPDVTVVIPTLADGQRVASMRLAIDSVLGQEQVRARPLILINGSRFDLAVRREIELRGDLDVCYQPVGSLPLAIYEGRCRVQSTFFSYLDDDDQYLPNSLSLRVRPMLESADIDVVVANGLKRAANGQTNVNLDRLSSSQQDPLGDLMRRNWLASCGGVFRTESVGSEVFRDLPKYYEWTMVAFRLAVSRATIFFVDEETYLINETSDSLSMQDEYREAMPHFLERLMAMNPPPAIARALRNKQIDSHHWLATHYVHRGSLLRAWRHHLRSIGSVYGTLRYLPFTRHLLLPRKGAAP